ncbi:MAG: glycosyltransferase family 2 protein [Bacteroidetes bacterium]|nr:glycosyltransferase family 2 protein [Bacteroidota bacterium]
MSLSGVVITFNEELKIERCLKSLQKVCDEIIVLDSFSTDNTCIIAENCGAKVYKHIFDGHIQQKNRAITYSSSKFVLSLDADEELSNELIQSINGVKNNFNFNGYSMNRLNNYGGNWIKHGAWYPDKKLRLWDSTKGCWGGKNPHDKYILNENCKIGHLKGNILHYTMNGFDDLKNQTVKFANIAAKSMFEDGLQYNYFQIVFKTFFRFVKEYILLLGFLDGIAGLQIALMNSYYVWLKYTLLIKKYKS